MKLQQLEPFVMADWSVRHWSSYENNPSEAKDMIEKAF
jgi:hypothetical protein